MAGDLKGLIQTGFDILTSVVDQTTGKIMLQIGSVVGGTADGDSVEQWQQYGFASRAPKPDVGKAAAQAVVIRTGDHDLAIGSQDMRALDLYGNLGFGEVAVFSAGEDGLGQARSLWKKDGSITHYTTLGNVKGGQAIYSRTGPGIDAATGLPDGHIWSGPWGNVKFDDTGFHILHKSGAQFHLGGIAGLPSPLDAMGSYCSITAAGFHVESAGQSLGAGVLQPLALYPATAAAITALQAQVTAIQAAMAIWANVTSNPLIVACDLLGGVGLLTAVTTGAAAGIAGVTTALVEMPANTGSGG